jgi:hypothetical protein
VTDVFLSYARTDDESFVASVYQSLTVTGISVWWDRVSMPSRGLAFLREIRDAISGCNRFVVLVGPAAVRSDYVRAEWQHALADAKPIIPVLRLGEMADLPAELRPLHCIDCRTPAEARGLADLRRALTEPVPRLGGIAGAIPPSPPHFLPRLDDLETLARTILSEEVHPRGATDTERTIVVHGMGGIGKTVLAASFARSTSTRRAFPDGVLWVAAEEGADAASVVEQALRLTTHMPAASSHVADNVSRLREALTARRVLIVVDDAWHVEQLESLTAALDPRSRLLVTTRNADLAIALGTRALAVGTMADDDARRLLADWSGLGPDGLGDDIRALATQCAGLPLALAINGAMLAEGAAPADLVAALRDADLTFAETRLGGYAHPTIVRSLDVSVDMLARGNPDAADRYRELAAFIPTELLPEAAVVAFWQNQAGLEPRTGRRLLERLQQRSLLQLVGSAPGRRHIRIHNIVRAYLAATARDPERLNAAVLAAYRAQCPGDWPTGPADGYFHRHLVAHLEAANDHAEVHRLLGLETTEGRSAWYEARDRIGEFDGYAENVKAAAKTSRSFGLQARYALISASLNDLARRMPAELLALLIAEGAPRWTPASALQRVRYGTEEEIATSLSTLAPYLPATALAQAIEIADSFRDDALRATALGALGRGAMRLSDPQAEAALKAVLALLEGIAPALRLGPLLAMAFGSPMPEGPRQAVAAAAMRAAEGSPLATVAAAQAFGAPPSREVVNAALAEVDEIEDAGSRLDARLRMFDYVAEQHRAAVTDAALADAAALGDGGSIGLATARVLPLLPLDRRRALAEQTFARCAVWADHGPATLVMLAASLDDARREAALQQAVAAAASKDYNSWTTLEFEAMLDQGSALPSAWHVRLLRDVLASVGRMGNPYWRARAIARVAADTAVLPEAAQAEVLNAALREAERIEENEFRGHALAAVALRSSEPKRTGVVRAALSAADRVGDEQIQSELFAALAPRVAPLQRELRDAAFAAATRIESPLYRAQTITSLASELGEHERAIAVIADIEDSRARRRALVELAAGACQRGGSDVAEQAIDAARRIPDYHEREQALQELKLITDAASGRLPGDWRLQPEFLQHEFLWDVHGAPDWLTEREPKPADWLARHLADALKHRWPAQETPYIFETLDEPLEDIAEWLVDEAATTARVYAAAAARLSDKERLLVIAAARRALKKIRHPIRRESALDSLLPLAPHLESALSEEVLEAALAVASRNPSGTRRAEALVLVAQVTPAARRPEALKAALAAARAALSAPVLTWQDAITRADLRGPSHVVKRVAAVAGSLAPLPRTDVLHDALKVAREIDDDYWRAGAILAVAGVWPSERGALLREALGHLEQMTESTARSNPYALQPESSVERSRAQLLVQVAHELATLEPHEFPAVWRHLSTVLALCSRATAMTALSGLALSDVRVPADMSEDSARVLLDVCRWFP